MVAHHRRLHPSFYLKAAGEVDLAYVEKQRFFPVEIKWTSQIRPNDLRLIQTYKDSRVVAKTTKEYRMGETLIEPLPLHLLRLPE